MTVHSAKRFVEKIDFLTTPGYLSGPGSREKAGLPPGTGPFKVVTNLCIMGYHSDKKRMQVESVHPGVSKKEIEENTGFKLLWAESVGETEKPSDDELRILREEVDPKGVIIGRAV